MGRGRATLGGIAATAVAASLLGGAAPAGASEYSESLARKVESEIVYVDPKAKPKISVAEAGRIRLRIVKEAPGRVKMALVPERRADREGGLAGLGAAVARDVEVRGSLLLIAGERRFLYTSHPASAPAGAAVDEAFQRNAGDLGDALLASVKGLAAADPGPSGDPQGAPSGGIGDFNDKTDDIFDSVEDTFRVTTIIIALSFVIPVLGGILYIVYRVRRSRREAEGDIDFAQEGLRNQLIALGDEIRALEVDTQMPGANALALADYEAAVQQYDRANNALERVDQNPRHLGEARAAIKEGERRISDAKVRLGVTPIP